MSEVEITITGDLDATLNQIIQKADDVIDRGGELGKKESQARAPVRSGELRDGIEHEHTHLSSDVGTNVKHGPFQELGTQFIKPHPFLLPGFEIAAKFIKDEMGKI